MIYLMADRPCGGKFLYNDHPMLMEQAGEDPETLYAPMIEQWEANRIAYLLLLDNDRPVYGTQVSKDHFLNTKILREYLVKNFRFEIQIEDFSLYRRIPSTLTE